MHLKEFQKRIEEIYFERDSARGLAGTHMWFCEEVGELTRALRRGQTDELAGEFPDVGEAAAGCRFSDRSHAHEPDCAVRAAVAAGTLPEARYRSYLRILATL